MDEITLSLEQRSELLSKAACGRHANRYCEDDGVWDATCVYCADNFMAHKKALILQLEASDHQRVVQQLREEIERLKLTTHKWKFQRVGGDPASADSLEMVRFCEYCGMEDNCEDDLPECEVTRELLYEEIAVLRAQVERLSKPVSDEEVKAWATELTLGQNWAFSRAGIEGMLASRKEQP